MVTFLIPSFLPLTGRVIPISFIHLFKCGLTDSYFIRDLVTVIVYLNVQTVPALASAPSSWLLCPFDMSELRNAPGC